MWGWSSAFWIVALPDVRWSRWAFLPPRKGLQDQSDEVCASVCMITSESSIITLEQIHFFRGSWWHNGYLMGSRASHYILLFQILFNVLLLLFYKERFWNHSVHAELPEVVVRLWRNILWRWDIVVTRTANLKNAPVSAVNKEAGLETEVHRHETTTFSHILVSFPLSLLLTAVAPPTSRILLLKPTPSHFHL